MLTKTKSRFLPIYNKLIPSFWFGLHLSIVSVCLFVILFNCSWNPVFPISARNDEPAGNEPAARMQGEANQN